MSLIAKLSAELIQLPPEKVKKMTIVFPNRRAGLFLRQQMSREASKPQWLPVMLSVEEAFSRWSGYAVADKLTLIIELIQHQLSQDITGGYEAAAFIGHAKQMAIDFDEIDHSLASPDAVFQALSDAKAAEIWHPDGSPLSAYETAYLRFFRSLLPYYHSLKQSMISRGLLWQGAIAALLASWDLPTWNKVLSDGEIWFAGFNALTPAEEKVMTTLCEAGKAKMFWDLDEYYLNSDLSGQHQAGLTMRRFMQKHSKLVEHWIENKLSTQPKKIVVVSATGSVGQAKALGNMLMQQNPNEMNTEQAIVLADEKLLEPVLNSLPAWIENVNLTMGYPLTYSPLFQLTEKIASLATYNDRSGAGALPMMLLVDILLNPLITSASDKTIGSACEKIALTLAADGSSNVYLHRLESHLGSLPDKSRQFIEHLLNLRNSKASELPLAILNWLSSPGLLDLSDDLKARHHQELSRLLNKLSVALEISGLKARDAIPALIKQLGQNAQIKLTGEPLSKLQVMGMLETRNLAFRRVHLLSANEGSLPPGKKNFSLIPADLRRHFGLPNHNEKDAIAAFHFYHLLQNAEELVFYYNTEADDLGGGEMSRFLLQIRHELMKTNPNISWKEMVFNPPLPSGLGEVKIEIPKNEAIRQAIANKAENGLSPSAISRWFNCSLQFYLGEILRIQEKPSIGELPGSNVTGTIIHNAIQLLYKPYINKPLNIEALNTMNQRLEAALDEAFEKELPGVSTAFGRNALHYAIVRKMVMRTIEFDKNSLENGNQITILYQEKSFNYDIQTPHGTLRLKGFPDRIDTNGEKIRIIDFKTGKYDKKMLKTENMSDLKDPVKKYAFQLACYVLMVSQADKFNGVEAQGYILPLRYHNEDIKLAELPFDPMKDFAQFEAFLTAIYTEMLDPLVPIKQTQEIAHCANCTFIRVCNREATAAY
jgi:hypothetical protein